MIYSSGICNFCGTGCGTLQKCAPDGMAGVLPRDKHLVSRGRLCVRGWHLHEAMNSPQRLNSSLIKENNSLKEVNYSEAIKSVTANLKKYKGDEIAFIASPRSSNEDIFTMVRSAREVFKSPNLICSNDAGHSEALSTTFKGTGNYFYNTKIEDIADSDVIMVVGADLTVQNPIIGSEVHLAKEKGAKVITVSSRATRMTRLSTIHLQPRPGSFQASFRALGRTMIDKGIAPIEAVNSIQGFDSYYKKLYQNDFLWHIKRTDLSDVELIQCATILAEAKKLTIIVPSGISGLDKDTLTDLHNLYILSGAPLRKEGGMLVATGIANMSGAFDMGCSTEYLPGPVHVSDTKASNSIKKSWGQDANSNEGSGLYNNKKIKALVIADHDFNIENYKELQKQLEYIVFISPYPTGSYNNANAIIPSRHFCEYDGTYTNAEHRLQFNRSTCTDEKEVKALHEIWQDIAAEAGYSWSYKEITDIQNDITSLAPSYKDAFKEAAASSQGSFLNKNDSKEWAFGNASDKEVPLAQYGEFSLMTGSAEHFWHNSDIMKLTHMPKREYNATLLLYPQGYIEISSIDAENKKLRNKEMVKVSSASGDIEAQVKINSDLKEGYAHIPFFIRNSISDFLHLHDRDVVNGEDGVVKVTIEKV